MRIVIHPNRIGLVIVLLLLTRRLRIVHQNRDMLSIRRDRVARNVGLNRLRFRRVRARRQLLRRRNRVSLLRLIHRRDNLHLERMRFAAIHGQPKQLRVLAAMRHEQNARTIRHPLPARFAALVRARRIGQLSRRIRLHVHEPQMRFASICRGIGNLNQHALPIRRHLRLRHRAHVAHIFIGREVILTHSMSP